MKNFRKAAIAVAAASSVAFAGTAVASAQEETNQDITASPEQDVFGSLSGNNEETADSSLKLPTGSSEDSDNEAEDTTASSEGEGGAKPGDALYFGGILAKIGKALQAGEGINGFELFGSAQSEYQPPWAQLFKFGSIALLLGAIVSAAGFALNR